jgi:hypothetical protein
MLMSKLITFVAGAGVGAAAAYFLDNDSGTRRRKIAADKAGRFTREGAGTVTGAAQSAGAQAKGVAAKAQHVATGGDSAPGDDNTLKAKVESEVFRDADAPKGSVDISVANGIVERPGPERGARDEDPHGERRQGRPQPAAPSGRDAAEHRRHARRVVLLAARGSAPRERPGRARAVSCTGAVDRARPATSKTQKSRSITGTDTL